MLCGHPHWGAFGGERKMENNENQKVIENDGKYKKTVKLDDGTKLEIIAEKDEDEHFFTKNENGLIQDWGGMRVFCNPPYGREIYQWVEKSYHEGHKENTLVVFTGSGKDRYKMVSRFCISQIGN